MGKNVGNITVTVDTRNLERLMNGLNQKAQDVLDIAAAHVQENWHNNIVEKNAIQTGYYRDTLRTEKPDVFERIVTDSTDYAIYVEFGWTRGGHNHAAKPCAAPAVEAERPHFYRAWEALLRL